MDKADAIRSLRSLYPDMSTAALESVYRRCQEGYFDTMEKEPAPIRREPSLYDRKVLRWGNSNPPKRTK